MTQEETAQNITNELESILLGENIKYDKPNGDLDFSLVYEFVLKEIEKETSKKITLEFNSEEELEQYKKEFLLLGLKKRNDKFLEHCNNLLKPSSYETCSERLVVHNLKNKFEKLFGIKK